MITCYSGRGNFRTPDFRTEEELSNGKPSNGGNNETTPLSKGVRTRMASRGALGVFMLADPALSYCEQAIGHLTPEETIVGTIMGAINLVADCISCRMATRVAGD